MVLCCKLWNKEDTRLQKSSEITDNLSRVISYNQSFIVSSCLGDSVCRFVLTSLARKGTGRITSPWFLPGSSIQIHLQVRLDS